MSLLLARAAMNHRGGGSSVTAITWNPSDKNAAILLDEGNKRAYHVSAAGWRSVRSATSFTTGAGGFLMIEVQVVGSSNVIAGFMKSAASLNSFVGSDANGWGYYAQNGNKFNGGSGVAYGATLAGGDKFRAKLHSNGDLEFFKNGVSQGIAFTGLSGTFYAAASVFDPNDVNGARAT